jgi:hypothetical protein
VQLGFLRDDEDEAFGWTELTVDRTFDWFYNGSVAEYQMTRHAKRLRRRAVPTPTRHGPTPLARQWALALPAIVECPDCKKRYVLDQRVLGITGRARGVPLPAEYLPAVPRPP